MPDVITVDSAKTVLVPVELYERGAGESYLRFNGMALANGEVAVESEPQDGIVAVIAVSDEVWNLHRDKYERGGVVVSSPLLDIVTRPGRGRKRDVNIFLTTGNVYLAVWENGLRMAEAMPDNSIDSILYYLQVVGRDFRLRKFDIHVGGQRAGLVADTLRHYYKGVKIVV